MVHRFPSAAIPSRAAAAIAALIVIAQAHISLAADEKPTTSIKRQPSSPSAQADEKPGPKYLLQYKFRDGEDLRWATKHVATIETTISGTTQTTEMSSQSTKVWRVTTVDPAGDMTFEHLIENVDMRNQMSGRQEVRYNSQTDGTPPLGYADVAKSIGKVLSTVTIDPTGAVLKREEKQLKAVADSSGSVLVMPLPKQAVKVGHVWSLPIEVTVNLADDGSAKAIQTRQRFELEKVEGDVATIGVETQVLTPIDNPKIQVQLIQRLSKGQIRFDLATGRIISHSTDLDQRVLGFSGAESAMHYVAKFSEELLPPAASNATTPAVSKSAVPNSTMPNSTTANSSLSKSAAPKSALPSSTAPKSTVSKSTTKW